MMLETTLSQPTTWTAAPTVHAESETGRLRRVIIGYPDNFDLEHAEIINETQKQYYFGENRPRLDLLKAQMDGYVACLESRGVEVWRPYPLPNVPDQLMPRDIGVVIGDTFLLTRMANASRQPEWQGIAPYLEELNPRLLPVPEDFVVEGGDIVMDKGCIFVGIGQRTTAEGARWLAQQFPNYEVVPVFLKSIAEGENVLHLDCAFVPVGEQHALIYPEGMHHIPPALRQRYELIPITRAEQDQLGTNVLSISPTEVIGRADLPRISAALRGAGLTVYDLPYTEAPKTGGSFRCCSLPLWRD